MVSLIFYELFILRLCIDMFFNVDVYAGVLRARCDKSPRDSGDD